MADPKIAHMIKHTTNAKNTLGIFTFPSSFGGERKKKKGKKRDKRLDLFRRPSASLSLADGSSIEILPCHVTALRPHNTRRHMRLRELGPYDSDTTRGWKDSDYDIDSSFKPRARTPRVSTYYVLLQYLLQSRSFLLYYS